MNEKTLPVPDLSQEEIMRLKPLLKNRIPVNEGPGCFLCKWIHEDLEANGKLTDYPNKQFPVSGKHRHLQLEYMIR